MAPANAYEKTTILVSALLASLAWVGDFQSSAETPFQFLLIGTVLPVCAFSSLAVTPVPDRRYFIALAVMGCLFLLLAFHPAEHIDSSASMAVVAPFVFSAFWTFFVVTTFFQAGTEENRWWPSYAALHRFAWSNALALIFAFLFLAAIWLLIWLFGALFSTIGIASVSDFFFDATVSPLVCGLGLGIGLIIARGQQKAVETVMRLRLALMAGLLPLLGFGLSVFVLALPVTGLDPLWDTGQAAVMLIFAMVVLIVLINGVVQDGTEEPAVSMISKPFAIAGLLTGPILAGLALTALVLRINQYGVTPMRIWALVLVGLCGAYCLSYAAALVWRRGHWLGLICRVNAPIAVFFTLLVPAMSVPGLRPLDWSISNQFNWAINNPEDVSPERLAFLWFKAGEDGQAAVRMLAERSETEQAATAVMAATSAYDIDAAARRQQDLSVFEDRLRTVPPFVDPPAEILTLVKERFRWQTKTCSEDLHQCGFVAIDLDDDGMDEYVLLINNVANAGTVFRFSTENGWQDVGRLSQDDWEQTSSPLWGPDGPESLETTLPQWRDLSVGGTHLRFQPN